MICLILFAVCTLLHHAISQLCPLLYNISGARKCKAIDQSCLTVRRRFRSSKRRHKCLSEVDWLLSMDGDGENGHVKSATRHVYGSFGRLRSPSVSIASHQPHGRYASIHRAVTATPPATLTVIAVGFQSINRSCLSSRHTRTDRRRDHQCRTLRPAVDEATADVDNDVDVMFPSVTQSFRAPGRPLSVLTLWQQSLAVNLFYHFPHC